MPSIITGYEYDIFISYRQKDNKGDRWVSEFVEALKTELESTFKEEISIYFDINPHDGLLETHDVDASLKEKLKCLVFIPIISRTYCDPKSFAWEHEFKAFVEQARQDQFGLKIKLPGGNVANRVLPVRIYDLDVSDIKLCESILGGVLRSVDFIYKSAGVNRPLLSKEENPQDNLNHTNYRDQINKVANSIKEIITAIGQYSPQHEEVSREVFKPVSVTRTNNKTKIFAASIVALALIVLGILFIPKLIRSEEQLKKSIAVLPFTYLSDEPEKQYLADGMMDAILLHLSKIEDLRVLDRTSVEQYRGTTKTTFQIGKELDVEYLLEGSFQKHEDNVRLIVQLIKASERGHVWANEYNNKWSEIFSVQSEVAQTIAKELNAAITPEKKQLIEKIPTTNLTAYDFFLMGNQEYRNYWGKGNLDHIYKSMDYFLKAVELDPDYSLAYTGLGRNYWLLGHFDPNPSPDFWKESRRLLKKAIELDPGNGWAYANLGVVQHNWDWDSIAARKSFEKAIYLSPNTPDNYMHYIYLEYRLGNCDKVASLLQEWKRFSPLVDMEGNINLLFCQEKFQQIINISDQNWDQNITVGASLMIISAYAIKGNFNKALEITEYMIDKFGDPSMGLFLKGMILAMMGDREGAYEILSQLNKLSESRRVYLCLFASIYIALGEKIQAQKYLEQALQEREFMLHEIVSCASFYLIKDEPWVKDIIRRSWIPLSYTE